MATISEMVQCLKDTRERRLAMEKQAKEMKAVEDELTERLLMEMGAQNLKSINIEGVARVAVRDTYHIEIADIEKLTKAMFIKMMDAIRNGHSMTDALMLQQRVAKSQIEDMLTSQYPDGIPAEAYDSMGLRKVDDRTLSLTKN